MKWPDCSIEFMRSCWEKFADFYDFKFWHQIRYYEDYRKIGRDFFLMLTMGGEIK